MLKAMLFANNWNFQYEKYYKAHSLPSLNLKTIIMYVLQIITLEVRESEVRFNITKLISGTHYYVRPI